MNIFHADPYKSGKGRQYKNALPSPEFVERIGQWTSFSLQFGS